MTFKEIEEIYRQAYEVPFRALTSKDRARRRCEIEMY